MLTQPTKFGPYLLLERISLGGMAEVFKAIEFGIEGFERTVAVKRILPHVAEDEEFITMFKDEAHIAVQLQHSNIAQIYSLGHEDDSFYIALEYVAGRDVRTIFERCRKQKTVVPLAQTCFTVMKVCEGLDYAHNKKDKYGRPLNIIHRDVSPPNILVSYEGAVKLCDFGVAKAAGRVSQTQAGILKGKFGYMSPEQVRGHALDRRSDVFSAGVCLWEMLTGVRLFHGDTDFATLEKVRSGEVQPPRELNSEIPPELEVIVLKSLAPNPHERFQSAAELHDRLQGFLFNQGLFYSRKDLAGWMRVHYAQDIESEKVREHQRAGIVRQFKNKVQNAEGGSAQSAEDARNHPTSLPPTKPPPPPPPPSSMAGGEAVPVRRSIAPTLAHVSASANISQHRSAPPQPRGRAKTLLSTALAPGIITPSSQTAERGSEDIPDRAANALLKSDTSQPTPSAKRSTGAQALADLNSIPSPFSRPQKSSTLEWDDDELETHLFAQKVGKQEVEEPELPAKLASPVVRGRQSSQHQRPPKSSKSSTSPASSPTSSLASSSSPSLRLPKPFASVSNPEEHPDSSSPTSLPPPVPMSASQDDPAIPPIRDSFEAIATTSPPRKPYASYEDAGSSPSDEGKIEFRSGPFAGIRGRNSGIFAFDEKPSRPGIKWLIVVGVVVLFGVGVLVINSFSNGSTASVSKVNQAQLAKKQIGKIQLDVKPSTATVSVDGRSYPGDGTRIIEGLSPGFHKLKVDAGPEYFQDEQDVQIDPGQTVKSQIVLQPRNVNLVGTVTPPNATIYLVAGQEETELGVGSIEYALRREPGVSYSLRFEAHGHKSKTKTLEFSGDSGLNFSVELEANSAESLRPTLGSRSTSRDSVVVADRDPPSQATESSASDSHPAAQKTAGLKIGTEPGLPPAIVYLNGRVVSERTPVLIEVRPGNYKIEWEWPNGKRATRRISVKDGQTALVKGNY